MKRKNKTVTVAFRTSEEQALQIQQLAEKTGQAHSAVLRQIVDSALLVQRPVIVSNYQQTTVQHGA